MIDGLEGRVELRVAPGGYLQVWPRPSLEALQVLYGEDFYDRDHTEYLTKMEAERDYWDATWSMRRKLMESALAPSRRRLLDVGCSGGFLLDHFQEHGWQGTGIEPSKSAARWAARRYGLDVFVGELLDYHSSPSTRNLSIEREGDTSQDSTCDSTRVFDAVHSAQVLEHVLDPEACIARIASLLAPEGIAYIEVPNDFNVLQETARERLSKPAWWVSPRFHLTYFNYETLSALLRRHGLIEVDRLASFPIEMFLLMGEDYVGHPEVGAACHARRMAFERAFIDTDRVDELLAIYRALAQAGLGRTCGILARKQN